MLLREAVGTTLRAARTEQSRTLRDVARDARVSLGYLSEVERGQKEASSELLASICAALALALPNLLLEVSRSMHQQLLGEVSARPVKATLATLTIVALDNTSAHNAVNIEDAA